MLIAIANIWQITDWRRKPNFRAISTLGCYHIYMNFQNEWQAASICLAEGIRAAQALGWHMLGDDPLSAVADVAFPPDSLMSRELPVQVVYVQHKRQNPMRDRSV